MYTPLFPVLMFILIPILSIVSKILFSMWIYKDAKKKNLQSVWWIIGVIFVSWIAFVFYLVYSKDKPQGSICPICGTYNFHNGDFCVHCGNSVVKDYKKDDKGLIYGGVITCILSVVLGAIFTVFMIVIGVGNYNPYEFDSYSYEYDFIEPFSNSYYEGISTNKLVD